MGNIKSKAGYEQQSDTRYQLTESQDDDHAEVFEAENSLDPLNDQEQGLLEAENGLIQQHDQKEVPVEHVETGNCLDPQYDQEQGLLEAGNGLIQQYDQKEVPVEHVEDGNCLDPLNDQEQVPVEAENRLDQVSDQEQPLIEVRNGLDQLNDHEQLSDETDEGETSRTTPNEYDQSDIVINDHRNKDSDFDDDNGGLRDAILVSNRFGMKLYQAIKKKESDEVENVLFSPLSLSRALTMIHRGARGSTAKQMDQIMKLSSLSDDAFKKMCSELLTNEDCKIKVASRLYGQKGLRFYLKYLAAHSHGVRLETIDFLTGSKLTVEKINTWVETQTNGKIQDMLGLETLPTSSCMILIDAVYFHSEMTVGFDPSATEDLPFHVSEREETTVPMMYREGIFDFYRDKKSHCKVISIPYKGEQLTLLIALPDRISDLNDVEGDLDEAKLQSWNEKMKKKQCQVTLPIFSLSETVSLVPYLQRMGLKNLFAAKEADLSGIAKEDSLCISDVFHKSVLTVDEKGGPTDAALSSKNGLVTFTTKKVFKADHPFVVFVYNQAVEAIVYMGCVKYPYNVV